MKTNGSFAIWRLQKIFEEEKIAMKPFVSSKWSKADSDDIWFTIKRYAEKIDTLNVKVFYFLKFKNWKIWQWWNMKLIKMSDNYITYTGII